MINFKSHNSGFTFFEVIAALFIFSMVVTSTLLLQQSSFRSVVRSSQSLWATFNSLAMFGKSSLLHAQGKKPDSPTTLGSPAMELSFKESDPPSQSSLKKVKQLKMQRVVAQWQGVNNREEQTMIRLVYRPEKKS